jgi:hypothetical protein
MAERVHLTTRKLSNKRMKKFSKLATTTNFSHKRSYQKIKKAKTNRNCCQFITMEPLIFQGNPITLQANDPFKHTLALRRYRQDFFCIIFDSPHILRAFSCEICAHFSKHAIAFLWLFRS